MLSITYIIFQRLCPNFSGGRRSDLCLTLCLVFHREVTKKHRVDDALSPLPVMMTSPPPPPPLWGKEIPCIKRQP